MFFFINPPDNRNLGRKLNTIFIVRISVFCAFLFCASCISFFSHILNLVLLFVTHQMTLYNTIPFLACARLKRKHQHCICHQMVAFNLTHKLDTLCNRANAHAQNQLCPIKYNSLLLLHRHTPKSVHIIPYNSYSRTRENSLCTHLFVLMDCFYLSELVVYLYSVCISLNCLDVYCSIYNIEKHVAVVFCLFVIFIFLFYKKSAYHRSNQLFV